MWFDYLERNMFIKNLYFQVPEIGNVRIAKAEILDEGNRVSISFDMPKFADNVPAKWQGREYNTVNVHLDFFGIREVSISSNSNTYRGSIEIQKDDSDLLTLVVSGTVNMKVIAESGLIQSIEGYCKIS